MAMSGRRQAAAQKVGAAEDAVRAVDSGLRAAGIVLPSLRVDPVSCARIDPEPLIDLGRCNLETAQRLAAVLRGSRS